MMSERRLMSERNRKQYSLRAALFVVAAIAAVCALFATRAHYGDIAGTIFITTLCLVLWWLKTIGKSLPLDDPRRPPQRLTPVVQLASGQ
jgi:hypothetical protein